MYMYMYVYMYLGVNQIQSRYIDRGRRVLFLLFPVRGFFLVCPRTPFFANLVVLDELHWGCALRVCLMSVRCEILRWVLVDCCGWRMCDGGRIVMATWG